MEPSWLSRAEGLVRRDHILMGLWVLRVGPTSKGVFGD